MIIQQNYGLIYSSYLLTQVVPGEILVGARKSILQFGWGFCCQSMSFSLSSDNVFIQKQLIADSNN